MKTHTNKKIRGEVFTPKSLVDDMLDKLPKDRFSTPNTFLDNSCGTGNFLVNIVERKMAMGCSHEDSLRCVYGVEIDENNHKICQQRLLDISPNPSDEAKNIVNQNIICADALDENHVGWADVGFYWNNY